MGSKSINYQKYLEEQRQKVNRLDLKGKNGLAWELDNFGKDKRVIINQMQRIIPPSRIKGDILVVGARFGSDIDLLALAGYQYIVGIDIYDPPKHPKVLFKDAHSLSQLDHKFGLVYVYHVMEHLLFPSKVIREIQKPIIKNGFVVVVTPSPLRKKEGRDAQTEFDSFSDLIGAFLNNNFQLYKNCKLPKHLKMNMAIFRYLR